MPPFPWPEYLSLSRNIIQNIQTFNNHESVKRCAISRAYYAAFCFARNYARDYLHFRPTGTGKDHELVVNYFKNNGMVNISFRLLRLKGWRETSDYDDNLVGNANSLTTNAFLQAETILNEISQLIP
jgi:uncharacterized protein (UPF0332 family)